MSKREKFEQFLRHIMCIFLGLETLLFCVAVTFFTDNGNFSTQLRFHVKDLGSVFAVVLVCAIPVVCCILSIGFRGFYLFYEGIHVLLGLMLFHPVSIESVLWAIIVLAAESLRFIIYCVLNRIYDDKCSSESKGESAEGGAE